MTVASDVKSVRMQYSAVLDASLRTSRSSMTGGCETVFVNIALTESFHSDGRVTNYRRTDNVLRHCACFTCKSVVVVCIFERKKACRL